MIRNNLLNKYTNFNLSLYKFGLIFLLFFLVSVNNSYSQIDSSKIRIGPDELQVSKGARYFNFSDKNKVNIEVIVLGTGAGKYLIPEGTSIFDFLIMMGGTASDILDDVKIVRFKTETPIMQAKEVSEYDYGDLYGDKMDILKSKPNPFLKPGDMVIVPEPRSADQSLFYYIRETVLFIGTLISFYYLIDNLVYRTYR